MEKEKRVKKIARTYYSRKDVQEAIFKFCQKRETIPRYIENFGKRPDTLQYPSDIAQQVKKGATSFHCSEEIWSNPLELSTDLKEEDLNNLRDGWDLLIDIDCKWFDYSKKAAQAIIEVLKNHSIKNFSIKFSGSKGFHILIPWRAFPQEVGGKATKDLFPELPRKIVSYIKYEAEKILLSLLPEDFYSQFKNINIRQGIKCGKCREIATSYKKIRFYCPNCKREELKKSLKGSKFKRKLKCPDCSYFYEVEDLGEFYECKNCRINSEENPENFSKQKEIDLFELMGLDLVLVSPRHLFRAPYSLHEKTCLASIVLDEEEIENFQPKLADPLRVKIKNFYPEAEKEEARELLISALDWYESREKKKEPDKKRVYEEIKIDKSKIIMPPCISNILKGLKDGKKRALFILLNYFKSLGLNFDEIENRIKEWNKKNEKPLRQGYIQSQITWHKKQKKVLPPNCDKTHYKDIGVCEPDELCGKIKNPVNYTVRKSRFKK